MLAYLDDPKLQSWYPAFLVAVAVGALGFAYHAQIVLGLEPCNLCLYQRVPYAVIGLAGAAAYMASFAWVKSTGVLDHILGGKATLGPLAGTKYPAVFGGIPGEWLGLVLGVVFIAIAVLLPARLRGNAD